MLATALSTLAQCWPVYAYGNLESAEPSRPVGVRKDTEKPVFPEIPLMDATGVTLDGIPDESVWARGLPLNLAYESYPADNVAAPEMTRASLFTTQDMLYLAIWSYDSQPQNIRAQLRQRDTDGNEDAVTFTIDAAADDQSAYIFTVNAAGAQSDSIVSSSGASNPFWNGNWASAAQRTHDGYTIEMAIPFAELSMPYQSDENRIWGINLKRSISHGRRPRLSLIPSDPANSCFECQLLRVQASSAIQGAAELVVTPYVMAGVNRTRAYPYTGDWQEESNTDVGVDIHWELNQSFTLAATLNPDFSQVESDTIQFDINTRFALLYPEHRPFFLEGKGYMPRGLADLNTRNINEPDNGVKLYGKHGSHSLGVFMADDQTTTFLLPSLEGSNRVIYDKPSINAALHYQYLFDGHSQIGITSVAREADHYSNLLLGIDGSIRATPSQAFFYELLGTRAETPAALRETSGVAAEQNGYAIQIGHSYGSRYYSATTSVTQTDDDFRFDLGSKSQVGIREWQHDSTVNLFFHPKSTWSLVSLGAGYYQQTALDTGDALIRSMSLTAFLSKTNESIYTLGFSRNEQNYLGQSFTSDDISLSHSRRLTKTLSMNVNYSLGDAIDFSNIAEGRLQAYGVGFSGKPWPNLDWSLDISQSQFDVAEGELYSTRLGRLIATWHLAPQHHIRLMTQWATTEQNPALFAFPVEQETATTLFQITYHYEVSARSSLRAGYNRSLIASETTGGSLPTDDAIFVKLNYAFQ